MRTELLEAFVAVAEERHFGRAADRLHLGQCRSPADPAARGRGRCAAVRPLDPPGRADRGGDALLARAPSSWPACTTRSRTRAAPPGRLGGAIGFTARRRSRSCPARGDAAPPAAGDPARPARRAAHAGAGPAPGRRQPRHRAAPAAVRAPGARFPDRPERAARRRLPAGHPLAAADQVPVADLAGEPFITYPADAVSRARGRRGACEAHGFLPAVALEVAETATLVSFVAAASASRSSPASVWHLSIAGAVTGPLPTSTPRSTLRWRGARRPLAGASPRARRRARRAHGLTRLLPLGKPDAPRCFPRPRAGSHGRRPARAGP